MSDSDFKFYISNRLKKVENRTKNETSILKSYVPPYVYEYAHFDSSVTSAILTVELINISGSTLTFNDTNEKYGMWISFKTEEGGTLAKQTTSTAFEPESIEEIALPADSIPDGGSYTYIIKLNNIGKELDDLDYRQYAKYWTIGFRQYFGGSVGVRNLYSNNAIKSWQITLIP